MINALLKKLFPYMFDHANIPPERCREKYCEVHDVNFNPIEEDLK